MIIYSILRILFDYFISSFVNKILKINIIKKLIFTDINSYLLIQKKNNFQLERKKKFNEAVWRFLIYLHLTIIGSLYIFYPTTQKWIFNTNYLWCEWPHNYLTPIMDIYCKLQVNFIVNYKFTR
jgi:putative flippase GtrA